jgi:ATP-dependent DNA helicase DinG
LIRTRADQGIVAVMDPRLVTKRYGEVFLRSLPQCDVTTDVEDVTRFVGKFEDKQVSDVA